MKAMRCAILLGVFSLVIVACGPSLVKIKPEVLSNIKNDQTRITLIHYNEPLLKVFSAGMVARSVAVGVTYNQPLRVQKPVKKVAAAMAPDANPGNAAGDPTTIQPSSDIKQALHRYLQEKEGLKNLHAVAEAEVDDDIVGLSKSYREGIIVDVKTLGWLLSYCPLSWSKYRLTYVVRSRMIRSSDKKLLWQAEASYVGDCDTAITLEEAYRNDCEGLKNLLKKAEKDCLDDLRKQFSPKN